MKFPDNNEDIRAVLDCYRLSNETDSETMGRLVKPAWTRVDKGLSDHRRPSMKHLEQTAKQFGILPCEVFCIVVNDVLAGDLGSGHDLLEEILEWIVAATPLERNRVLDGYAVSQRTRYENDQLSTVGGLGPVTLASS